MPLHYDTNKDIRVMDRRIGAVYFLGCLIISLYVLVYVMIVKREYLEVEKTNGVVLTKIVTPMVEESAQSAGPPLDIFDFSVNPGEQGAVFLPTRVVVTRGQVQEGFCESPMHQCKVPADCDIGDSKLQKSDACTNGHCIRRQWCPAQMAGVAQTQVHYVDVESYDIWFKTDMHFHKFELDVSTADDVKLIRWPAQRANTYTLRDLVAMARTNLQAVKEEGAILAANNVFECDLSEENCNVRLQVSNLDSKTGFNFVREHFYEVGGVRKRDVYHFFGIRIIATATGIGTKVSLAKIVLHMSSVVALLSIAQFVADFVLLRWIAERKHYKSQKVIEMNIRGE